MLTVEPTIVLLRQARSSASVRACAERRCRQFPQSKLIISRDKPR